MSTSPSPAPSAADAARIGASLRMVPATFGMVMATGILSIASALLGAPRLAHGLFLFNLALDTYLWGLMILRVLHAPRDCLADLTDHLRGPSYFTLVASTAVLGSQFALLTPWLSWALAAWAWALLLWVGLTYTIFTVLTIKPSKPTLEQGINGAWLLAVVATQSIAVLSALLAVRLDQPIRLELNFFALSMWLWGGMLYIWMMSLIFYRYTFFPFSPGDLSPPYWINMGAMAISTLAGARLIMNAPDAPFLQSIMPFVKGFTVFYWATGSWWIPMLVILAFWRHVIKRFPMRYDPLYWGAIFPIGMYAACTENLIRALSLEFLEGLPRIFWITGLLAWSVATLGFIRFILARVRKKPAVQ